MAEKIAGQHERRTKKRRFRAEAAFVFVTCKEELPCPWQAWQRPTLPGLSHSTIGAEEFNGRVRDGIGFMLLARTTRPAKDKENEASSNASAFKRGPRT